MAFLRNRKIEIGASEMGEKQEAPNIQRRLTQRFAEIDAFKESKRVATSQFLISVE